MKVKIKETGKIGTLSISDRKSGIDYTKDFIGNCGSLSDGTFVFNADEGIYEAGQSDYEWWYDVIQQYIYADEMMFNFLDKIEDDSERDLIKKEIEDACFCDFKDIPDAIIDKIEELSRGK